MNIGRSNATKTIAELTNSDYYTVTTPQDIPCPHLQAVATGVAKKLRGAKFIYGATYKTMYLYLEGCPVTLGRIQRSARYSSRGQEHYEFEVRGDFIENGKHNSARFYTKASKHVSNTVKNVCKYLKPHSMHLLSDAFIHELDKCAKSTGNSMHNKLRDTFRKITGIHSYSNLDETSYNLIAELEDIITTGFKFKNPQFNALVHEAVDQYAQLKQEEADQVLSYYFVTLDRIGDEVVGARWIDVDRKIPESETVVHKASVSELPHDLFAGLSLMAMANQDNQYIDGAGYYVSKDILYVAKQTR